MPAAPTIAPETWQLLVLVADWLVRKLNAGDGFACLLAASHAGERSLTVIHDADSANALRMVRPRAFDSGVPSAIAVAVDASAPDGRGGYVRGVLVRLQDDALGKQLQLFGPTGFGPGRRAHAPEQWVLLAEKPLWTDLT